jgi:dipeptidase D
MNDCLLGLKPQIVWEFFDEIRKIPRCSGNEEKIIEYLIDFAKKNIILYKKDSAGNVLITKKASKGKENSPSIILQSHVDMVCEKNSDACFDFSKDAIRLKQDKEWIFADGTTLGADDGIGVAIMLAILYDKSLIHGPLECLFTVSEETGLTGAKNIDEKLLSSKMMINIDTDDDRQLIIGSAAGESSIFRMKISKKKATKKIPLELSVIGLLGGHSGTDISKNRGNAIKILAVVLEKIFNSCGAELVKIDGGDKDNAIPREASCTILANNEDMKKIVQILINFNEKYKKEYKKTEKDVNIRLKRIATHENNFVFEKESCDSVVSMINCLPHGII